MTEKDSRSPAPSSAFRDRIADYESVQHHSGLACTPGFVNELLTCIREQQAALKKIAEIDYGRAAVNGCAYQAAKDATAVLDKWILP